MDKENVEKFKEMLLEKERETEKIIKQMKENREGEQDKYSPAELSNYDNHPADMGTELFQVEFANALKVHQEHDLKEIHDAIGRIDNGSYGICEFCGKEIDMERLSVLPFARRCLECEESRAVTPGIIDDKSRPVEEKVIDAPFGRKYLNQREDDEYEGLDYLNDLIKYGSSDTPQDMGGYHDYRKFYTNEIDNQGIVDDMDRVSNDEYKKQLPE